MPKFSCKCINYLSISWSINLSITQLLQKHFFLFISQVFLEGPLKCLCICNGLIPSSSIQLPSNSSSRKLHTANSQSNYGNVYRPLLQNQEINGLTATGPSRQDPSKPALFPLKTLAKMTCNSVSKRHTESCNGNSMKNVDRNGESCAQIPSVDPTTTNSSSSCPPHSPSLDSSSPLYQEMLKRLGDVSQAVSEVEQCVAQSSKVSLQCMRFRNEWTNIAIILDRIFFLTYVAIIVLSITFLFPRPSEYRSQINVGEWGLHMTN